MKSLLKNIFKRLGIEVRRIKHNKQEYSEKIIQLKPKGPEKGSVLFAYILEPFIDEKYIYDNSHTHYWESFQIANLFLKHGYSVDAIDYRNGEFLPKKEYDILISARTNLEKLAKKMSQSCKIVAHLDTAHWLTNNLATLKRCFELKERKGVIVKSLRIIENNKAIEYADYATVLGNSYTIDTYRYAGKPIYRIPITSCAKYPWDKNKNFEKAKKSFIWIGSHGFVHKGLDLVLEAFARMPDLTLYVCGPIDGDDEFKKAYHKELYETPNIKRVGWIDVTSNKFIEIVRKCVGIVYPSCAEGGGGCVINCMHAGLIPIVTREASVDIEDFGILISEKSVEAIIDTINKVTQESAGKIRKRAKRAWEFAREKHTREKFTEEYEKFISILEK